MSEVIQDKSKNSFIEKLKHMIIKENKKAFVNNLWYEEYLEQEIKKMIKERNKFVAITTPEEEKKFRAEVRRSISGAIASKEDEQKSVEDKKEEIDQKKKQVNTEKSNSVRDINSRQIGYLDRLELLHQMKKNMLREQLRKGEYAPNDKEYYKMLLLQKSIESDREDYINGLDEKTKVQVLRVEEEYKTKELELERRSNQKFRQELDEFSRLNTKIREINEWIEQKQQEMREGIVDAKEYQKEMKKKQIELDAAIRQVSSINPQKLQDACEQKARQKRLEKGIMGRNYMEAVYLRSSAEMKEKLNYKSEKEILQAAIAKKENNFYKQNGMNRILEQDKKHKDELEKELEKLNQDEQTPENIKRIAEVTKELRILDARIDSQENKNQEIEQGMKAGKDVESKLVNEEKAVAEDIKEIEKEFQEIDENIENMEQDIQTAGIQGKTDEEIKKEALKTGFVVSGVVATATGDIGDAAIAGAIAAEVKEQKERKSQGKIGEWENMVNDTPDSKAVENYRETQQALQEQQEQYEQERIRK